MSEQSSLVGFFTESPVLSAFAKHVTALVTLDKLQIPLKTLKRENIEY